MLFISLPLEQNNQIICEAGAVEILEHAVILIVVNESATRLDTFKECNRTLEINIVVQAEQLFELLVVNMQVEAIV